MNSPLPAVGKVSADVFDEVILSRLGRRRADVLVGPQNGVDVAVVDLGHDQVMVTTTDPIFVVPAYGWERAAWFAVHILASDAITSGLPPTHVTFDLNLPMAITREQLEALWTAMHDECDKLGMAVISGHTGRYQGCDYPMIGGATVICIGPKDQYVTPTMARPGDHVVITKGPGIEATGLFAVTFPDQVAAAYGRPFADEAQKIFWQMSVVEDALTAVKVGVRDRGVTSMHDATECGVWGGLVEIAQAAGVGMVVDQDQIVVQEPVTKICSLFDIDPYAAISEGTLLVTCRPHRSAELVARLGDQGILTSVVGEVLDASAGVKVIKGGQERELAHPRVDPFWAAFSKAADQAGVADGR